jgi:hypothetical protein
MSLQPLQPEAVQPTVQSLLAFLDRDDVMIPGNLNESITSAKSLCRAILSGQLVIAQNTQQQPVEQPKADETPKKSSKKAA